MGRLDAKIKERKKEQEDLAAKQRKLLKRDYAIVAASPEGLNVMKHIFNLSGYSKNLIVGNPSSGDILSKGTFYNIVRRATWVELRQLIPVKSLKKIEYEKLNLNVEDL